MVSPEDHYFSPAGPRVFAHRGLAVEAPENTLLAFAHALSHGVEYLETDVHASADGVAVIAHDPDLQRAGDSAVRVRELTVAELGALDLGEGQHMPTLAEALDAFPDARFNIDIKSPDAVLSTVETVRALRAERRVLISSFSERRRRAAVRMLPGVATSASGPIFVGALLAATVRGAAAVSAVLRGVQAVQIPERALRMNTLSPGRLRHYHAAGVEVHVWTINDTDAMHRLLDLGVDGIVTDRADLAIDVIRSRP